MASPSKSVPRVDKIIETVGDIGKLDLPTHRKGFRIMRELPLVLKDYLYPALAHMPGTDSLIL